MGFRCANINVNKLAEQLNINVDALNTAIRNSRSGGYARLWSFEDKGNFGNGRLSVSSRKDQNSDYETQFQDGFVCFSGEAYKKAKNLSIPDKGISIIILNCDVRNKYDKAKKQMYTNCYIYDFETQDGSANSGTTSGKTAAKKASPPPTSEPVEVDDEELPF